MIIPHISISRADVWHSCNQKYKFKYHLQQLSTEPTPIYFVFGKIVHKIIEEYTKSKGNVDINTIKKDVLSGKYSSENATPLDKEYKSKLDLHLRNFLRLVDKIGFEGETENEFLIDLEPPNQKWVKGVIDRTIIKNDEIFIIDYKTSKNNMWRKNSSTVKSDLQLQCYCWVAMNRFNVPAKNVKAALYYLEDAKLVPVCYSEKTLKNLPVKLLSVFNDIKSSNPDTVTGNVGDQCRRCEFRTICPFYSLI